MANIAEAPKNFILVINRTIQPTNASRTNERVGPQPVSTPGGGPTIPTSGVIWWPRK